MGAYYARNYVRNQHSTVVPIGVCAYRVYTNMELNRPGPLSDPIFRLHLVSLPKTASQSLL